MAFESPPVAPADTDGGLRVGRALLHQRDLARVLFFTVAALFAAAVATVAIAALNGDRKALIAAASCCAILPLAALGIRAGRLALVATVVAGLLLAVALYVVMFGTGIHDVGMMVFPIVIIMSGLLLDRRQAAAVSVLAVVAGAGVGFAELAGWLRTAHSHRVKAEDVLYVFVLLLLTAALTRLLTNALYRGLERAYLTERSQREAEKLRAVGQLAGGVAHDVNNQLTGILASASLLEGKLAHDPELSEHVRVIAICGRRSAELARKLLAFARRGKRQNVEIDVHALIDEVVALLIRSIDKRIAIERRFTATPVFTKGDPSLLESAVLNLALNARDAMPDGGHLVFETAVVDEEPSGAPAGRFVVVRVRDTGIGMTDEVRARIFEPFFTTKSTGTGMGLAAVYGTVQSHAGRITVETAPGKGSTFEIRLPSVQPAAAPVPDERPVRDVRPLERAQPFSGLRVLLAEDEPDVARATVALLESLGCSVTVCGNGREALALLDRAGDPIDVVMLDQDMPERSGIDVATDLRTRGVRVPIILTSGYARPERAPGLDLADHFLPKPFASNQLAGALHAVTSLRDGSRT